MAAFTTLGTIATGFLSSGAATALGTAATVGGTIAQASASRKASRASERAESLRRRQMELEARRARRRSIRETITTQAIQRANVQAQGATGSSSAAGGFAQLTTAGARNVQGINFGEEIGSDIFNANAAFSRAQGQAVFGQSINSLGATFASNSQLIGRLSRQGYGFGSGSPTYRSSYNPAYGQIG